MAIIMLAVFIFTTYLVDVHHVAATTRQSGSAIMNSTTARVVIEHPVLFNMPGLSEDPANETMILQGLNDLVNNTYSDLYLLFSARVLKSKGLITFTHALISRFPSVGALRVYYDFAIKEIANAMDPWLKEEYCVDYTVEMEEDAIMLDVTKELATHVTFIKVKSNVSDSDIKGAVAAFLGLARESNYAIQLTAGQNLCMQAYYCEAMSHAFSAYFYSVDAMEKWQGDPFVISVFQDTILPMADSFTMASLVHIDASSGGVLHHHVE